MSEEEALLAAVKANPDDDLPRLVYADWLNDNAGGMPCPEPYGVGHHTSVGCISGPVWNCSRCGGSGIVQDSRTERAEFIRLHIAIHGKLILMTTDEGERITAILQRLIHEDGAGLPPNWLAFSIDSLVCRVELLRSGQHRNGNVAGMSRGFTELVRCPAESWLKDGDAIMAKHPVRRVVLTTSLSQGDLEYWRQVQPKDGSGPCKTLFKLRGNKERKVTTLAYRPLGEGIGEVELLAACWPGIAFELPPTWQDYTTRYTDLPPRIWFGGCGMLLVHPG